MLLYTATRQNQNAGYKRLCWLGARFMLMLGIVFSCSALKAQHTEIMLGVHAPLYYAAGLEYNFNQKVSLGGQVGLLTKPFDEAIAEITKFYGADRQIVDFIGRSYRIGWNFQPTVKFHFGKTYLGLYYSHLRLYADVEPAHVLETFHDYNIPDWVRSSLTFLTVNSNLHNGGILLGRRMPFPNPAFELRLEASLAKTIDSKSYVRYRNGREVPFVSGYADGELKRYYLEYGYLPSINLMFVYKFLGKQ